MKRKINNIDELKWEIARLTELKREQEAYLTDQYTLIKRKVDAPTRIIRSIISSIPGVGLLKGIFSNANAKTINGASSGDWLNKAVRIGLPLVLNRTVLKKAGWLKKALVLFASQAAAVEVTQDNVTDILSKITKFIRPNKRKKKHNKVKPFDNEHLQEIVVESTEDPILGI